MGWNAADTNGIFTFTPTPTGNSGSKVESNWHTISSAISAAKVATNITSGTLAVARGGTGTGTAFTSGSVVFAGASGIYSQDNSNLFWDATNHRLGIGTSSPPQPVTIDADGSVQAHIRLRQAGATRYRSDLVINGAGGCGFNAYDDTGSVYLPFGIDGSRMTLNAGSGGNVGVGTTTVPFLLTLNNDLPIIQWGRSDVAKAYVGIANGTNAIINGAVANDMVVRTQGGKILFSCDSGSTVDASIDSAGKLTAISFAGFGIAPVGFGGFFLKSYTNTPSLPSGWVECNGQTLSDAASVYNGQVIPNLNGSSSTQRFLRGSTTSGTTGGSESHTHTISTTTAMTSGLSTVVTTNTTGSTSTLPSYYEVVWVMRVK